MTLAAESNGEVEIETQVMRVIPRAIARLLDRRTQRSDEVIHICAWCKCILHEGEWLEIDQAIAKMDFFQAEVLPQLSHGICPACDALVAAELEAAF